MLLNGHAFSSNTVKLKLKNERPKGYKLDGYLGNKLDIQKNENEKLFIVVT